MNFLFYNVIETNTPYFFGFLVFKENIIQSIISKSYEEIEKFLKREPQKLFRYCFHMEAERKTFKTFEEEIKKYFKKEFNKKFSMPYSLTNIKGFEKLVLDKTSEIPYGKVASYKKISEMIGNEFSYRAAGNALSKNPVPILIPCHRVIKSDNRIGFFTGGAEMKKFLLQLEGIEVQNGKVQSIEKICNF